MARNQKPVKIKRYKKRSSPSGAVTALKKVLVLAAAVVFFLAAGFFLGRPVINFLSGIDFSSPDVTDDISSTAQDSGQSSDGQQQPVTVSGGGVYYYAQTGRLTSERGIDGVISRMKAAGATRCVFDLKDREGYIHYESANEYASQLKADTVIDLGLLTSKLSENGMVPVARVYTFMDQMISTLDRSTAVLYSGTDTRWLDSSAALGGKSWANPASSVMQKYLTDLTDEILSKGVKEIIYAGYSTPTGYSLDKRDFGASMEQVLANMKNLLNTLKSKASAKGALATWQFEYSAVAHDGDYAQYIVHPYQLGAESVIITADSGQAGDLSVIKTLKDEAASRDISSFVLWVTDGRQPRDIQSIGSYFVS